MPSIRTLFRSRLARLAGCAFLLAVVVHADAAQVNDSVLDDVTREFSLDSATPADFSPFLVAPKQGASYPAVMGTPPAPLPPESTPGLSSPTSTASAPTAQAAPTCGQMLPYYGLQAGLGSVCTCPGGDFSATTPPTCTCANGSAGPVCSTPCEINLPGAQAAAGTNQTCSCPAAVTSAVQTIEPLSTYTASGWINAANWPDPNASWIFGTNPNTVVDGVTQVMQAPLTNSTTAPISATLYLAADDAAAVTLDGTQIGYYSDQGQSGSLQYPSTGGVTSFPVTIAPGPHTVQMAVTNYCTTCSGAPSTAAGILSIIDASGNVLLDSNGSWTYTVSNGASTPVCQTNCGGLLATSATYETNANQVCSCADPTAVAVPSCVQTCGAQLPAAEASAPVGSVCSCPSGNAAPGTPTCTQTCGSLLGSTAYPTSNCSCPGGADSLTLPMCQATCGSLLTQFQTQAGSNQTCSCPSGTGSYANPSCVTNCQGQIATLQGQYGSGYACTCTTPTSTTETPTCAQTCGSQLSAAQAAAGTGMVCACPNGDASPGTPICQQSCDAQIPAAQASYGSSYVCSCPNGATSTSAPVCQMTCGALMATNTSYQTNVDQTCSCPNGDANVGTPSCALTCQGQLTTTQNTLGGGYTCSCPSVSTTSGVVWAPVQTVEPLDAAACGTATAPPETCADWFPVAQWPDAGANWIYGTPSNYVQNDATETLQQTWTNSGSSNVNATLNLALDDFGAASVDGTQVASYNTTTGGIAKANISLTPGTHTFQITVTNSCPNCTPTGNPSAALMTLISASGQVLLHTDASWSYQQSTTQGPTCQVNCGGFLSGSPTYATNANQVCSCPSGANSTTTPSCAPTCGSQIATAQAQQGPNYTCSCPNGDANVGTPSCALNCGGMMATQSQYQSSANQICACPNGSASTGAPVCQPTCGAQLPAIQNSYGSGYTCSCPDGNTNLGAPSCTQNCGGLLATNATYQTNANQVCSCPSGSSSLTNPSCQATCGAQLASAQSSAGAGYTCSCPNGGSNLGTPSCALNCGGMMATNATYQSNASQTCSCPSGGTSLTTPSCVATAPTCTNGAFVSSIYYGSISGATQYGIGAYCGSNNVLTSGATSSPWSMNIQYGVSGNGGGGYNYGGASCSAYTTQSCANGYCSGYYMLYNCTYSGQNNTYWYFHYNY
jgi:hypothetical protein